MVISKILSWHTRVDKQGWGHEDITVLSTKSQKTPYLKSSSESCILENSLKDYKRQETENKYAFGST